MHCEIRRYKQKRKVIKKKGITKENRERNVKTWKRM
jgi:hypothetical protein